MEMIKINQSNINDELLQTVNARDLHGFLEIGKKFADWIKDRVGQYGFEINIDYTTYSQNGEKGRPAKQYSLSIDNACARAESHSFRW